MSRIHAKPYIRKVIDSLSDLQKVALLGLVNGETPIGGSANPTPKSLLNPSQYITGGDKNVAKYVALETAEGTYTGFLIYTNAYCCLVAYQDDSQNLDILDIDLSNMTYAINGENTSIADMRFEIEQSKEKMDVVAYIEEAIQEGDIAIDAANVISLENVDLSEGSAEAVLSSANWTLATDRDHECVLNLYLATQNVYPIGDVVELNRIAVSDDEVTFGGTFYYPNDGTYIGYTISAVFTEQSGSIHIVETEANKELASGEYPALHNLTIGGETYVVPEGGANIVEITSADIGSVLSEARAAEIEAADGLFYQNANQIYWKSANGAGSVNFVKEMNINIVGTVYKYYLEMNKTTRQLLSLNVGFTALPKEKIISEFSSSKSYSPGDLVYYNNGIYRCVVAHQGAWSNNDFTQTVLGDEIHSDIVTISATGVQSDEMAAKIQNAKALYYNNGVYVRISSTEFIIVNQTINSASKLSLSWNSSTKDLSVSSFSYNRVTSIDNKRGSITVDSSLQTIGSSTAGTLGLTGKLPYLDTAPTADNTSGFLTIVVLSAEPATRYNGYLYIITAAAA